MRSRDEPRRLKASSALERPDGGEPRAAHLLVGPERAVTRTFCKLLAVAELVGGAGALSGTSQAPNRKGRPDLEFPQGKE